MREEVRETHGVREGEGKKHTEENIEKDRKRENEKERDRGRVFVRDIGRGKYRGKGRWRDIKGKRYMEREEDSVR